MNQSQKSRKCVLMWLLVAALIAIWVGLARRRRTESIVLVEGIQEVAEKIRGTFGH